MNLDNSPTPMVLDYLQTSKENHYNPTPITNTLPIDSASYSGKRSSSFVDQFATFVDDNSLAGCEKGNI